MHSFLYHSPVDHHDQERWSTYGGELQRTLEAELGPGYQVHLGDQPVIEYGTDAKKALEAFPPQAIGPRDVRIDPWTSIVFYASLRVTAGDRVDPERTRSAL